MLTRLARLALRAPRRLLAAVTVAAALAVPIGGDVMAALSNGGWDDPAAESTRAERLLADRFHTGTADLIFLVRAQTPVDDPAARRDGQALTQTVASKPGVLSAVSYWDRADPSLRSTDGRLALVSVRLAGDEDARRATARTIGRDLAGTHGTLRADPAGEAYVLAAAEDISQADLHRAELITLVPTLLILVLVFGGALAALLPALVGAFTVVAGAAGLRILAEFTDVSLYAVNVVTALGLGLSVDYGLILLSRYREEIAAGGDHALKTTLATAGRTVVFSAVTVALSLAAMLVFPLYALRSFAYGGILAVALATLASLTLTPALLALLGPRITKPRRRADGLLWGRLARVVLRRPWPVLLAVTGILVLLAVPYTRVSYGLSDHRILPRSSPAQQTAETVRTEFGARQPSLPVVLPDTPPRAARDYTARLTRVDGVAQVSTGPRYTDGRGTWIALATRIEPYSPAGARLVERVREVPAPGEALVGGAAARMADTRAALAERLPWGLAIIAVATFLLLFAFTGSLVVPLKALLVNLLSLSATFGAIVVIFQDGHLRWLVGDFIVTGMTEIAMPVLIFCIAFGLSMDYEVLLLSRIKEEYDRTGDNATAVAAGLCRTGRLVTSAALILAVVFAALATSQITVLKLLGVGLTLAILVDATLVRGLLVPAVMRLAGHLNWWAPAPLRRLHLRLRLAEH